MICLPGLKRWWWWPVSVVFWFSCHWWIGKTQSSGNVKSSREFYLISSTGKVWPCTSFFRNWYRYYVFQFLNELKIYLRQNIAIKLSEECTGINWSFKTRGFCLLKTDSKQMSLFEWLEPFKKGHLFFIWCKLKVLTDDSILSFFVCYCFDCKWENFGMQPLSLASHQLELFQ